MSTYNLDDSSDDPPKTPASRSGAEDLSGWIRRLLGRDEMLKMGHGQRSEDMNLGMGWLYYAFARLIRPTRVVVIGSWRGFVPLILGRATADNCEPCTYHFIDPSFIDDQWRMRRK